MNKILYFLRKIGISLSKIQKKKEFILNSKTNPLIFLLDERDSTEITFEIPFENIRSWGGREIKHNPFVSIMHKIIDNNHKNILTYNFSNLRKCLNASETLGVSSNFFSKLAPELAVYPWDKFDMKTRLLNQKKNT